MAVVLLEVALAKMHPFFSTEKTIDGHLLIQGEENARKQRLKVWENYVEGKEPANGSASEFSTDDSWNREMVVNAPRGGSIASPKDEFEVFYIGYGNQETVIYYKLRPLDPSVSSSPGLAQLCSLAYIKVPGLEEDFGQEAAKYFSDYTLRSSKELMAMVESRDTTGGKVKGRSRDRNCPTSNSSSRCFTILALATASFPVDK